MMVFNSNQGEECNISMSKRFSSILFRYNAILVLPRYVFKIQGFIIKNHIFSEILLIRHFSSQSSGTIPRLSGITRKNWRTSLNSSLSSPFSIIHFTCFFFSKDGAFFSAVTNTMYMLDVLRVSLLHSSWNLVRILRPPTTFKCFFSPVVI